MGGSLRILGDYPLELDNAFKAFTLAKKMNIPDAIGYANGMLSDCYYDLGEYNTSLSYWRELTKMVEQYCPGAVDYMGVQLSRIFEATHQPDSALYYAKKTYEGVKNNKDLDKDSYQGRVQMSLLSTLLADAFAGKANYDSALFYYVTSVPVAINTYTETNLVDNYNGIAKVYKAKGNLDSAIWYAKKVLAEKITKTYPLGLLKAANMLADIYESKNKPDSTLKYLRMAIGLKDSLFNREKMIAVQNLTYKEQEKQKELDAARIKLETGLPCIFCWQLYYTTGYSRYNNKK